MARNKKAPLLHFTVYFLMALSVLFLIAVGAALAIDPAQFRYAII